MIVVCVFRSSTEKSKSELTPRLTVPWTGSNHAKSDGDPE
jgi:hypothetical protein